MAGSYGPQNCLEPAGRVSETGVAKSASTAPSRASLCSRTPLSATIVPSSDWVTSE